MEWRRTASLMCCSDLRPGSCTTRFGARVTWGPNSCIPGLPPSQASMPAGLPSLAQFCPPTLPEPPLHQLNLIGAWVILCLHSQAGAGLGGLVLMQRHCVGITLPLDCTLSAGSDVKPSFREITFSISSKGLIRTVSSSVKSQTVVLHCLRRPQGEPYQHTDPNPLTKCERFQQYSRHKNGAGDAVPGYVISHFMWFLPETCSTAARNSAIGKP